ncbi:MAG: serine hydrolase, partial [Bacteroidota bacterium]
LFGLLPKTKAISHQALEQYLASLPDSIELSILAERYDGELLFEKEADKSVPSASIIKVPILLALMRKVEKGEIGWEEPYILKSEDIVGGAGTIQSLEIGTPLTIEQLAKAMISLSDNTATNILIRTVGMDNINSLLRKLNLTQTTLQREMMDFEAVKAGRQNYTCASDMNRIFTLLLDQEILSVRWTNQAVALLKGCEDRATIPRMLPPSVQIAHKSGSLAYFRGDSGIIFAKEGPIILSIFVEKFDSSEQAEEIIGTIAKLILEWE